MSISIEYAYDKNGNLSRDDNKGMTFTYDLLGHPLAIVGSSNQTDYVYSADGRKLRATHTQYTSKNTVKTQVKTNYRGRIVANVANNETVNIRFLFSGGFYTFKNGALDVCHYFIQDYQGNNRVLIGTNGKLDQLSHYYPYGSLMGDLGTKDPHSYKYGGKELDRDFGIDLFDFEARQYDAKVPGFTSIDPLAEKYYGISPYAYCAGDPVNCVDPTGKWYIKVSAYNDRSKCPYALYQVYSHTGRLVFRTITKVTGKQSTNHDQGLTGGDTPCGSYRLIEWRKTGGRYPKSSYGQKYLLAMEYKNTNGSGRQGMHTHAGNLNPNGTLKSTLGCIRMAEEDIQMMKTLTDELNEEMETCEVIEDLDEKIDYETDKAKYYFERSIKQPCYINNEKICNPSTYTGTDAWMNLNSWLREIDEQKK